MLYLLRTWWQGLGRVERSLIMAALLILLLAASIVVWAAESSRSAPALQDVTVKDLERICSQGCVVLAQQQYDALSLWIELCALAPAPIQSLRYP